MPWCCGVLGVFLAFCRGFFIAMLWVDGLFFYSYTIGSCVVLCCALACLSDFVLSWPKLNGGDFVCDANLGLPKASYNTGCYSLSTVFISLLY